MKIAFCQINPLVADLPGNFGKIAAFLHKAKSSGADLAIFPELALFGYPPLDLVLSQEILELSEKYLQKLTAIAPLPFIIGLPTKSTGGTKRAYNSAAFFDGEELHLTHKQLLPTYDVFDESRVFSSGPLTKPFTLKGKKIGVLICEDGWQCGGYCTETHYPVDPSSQLHGVDFVVSINASPYRRGIITLRHKVFGAVAKKLGVPVCVVCQVGANDGLIFDGSSFVVYEDGTPIQIAKSFEEDLVYLDLDRRPKSVAPLPKDIELESALILGIRDYFQKQSFSKAILGLSGGIDSAVVLALLVKALGKDAIKTIYLPTRYNSNTSEEDALFIARHLGVDFSIIPIQRLFEEFQEALNLKPGLAMENIQARIRAILLMGVSNQEGRLLINTSNKSELSMGYSTIYGDLCGAICPLGDLWKEEVYELAKIYVKEGSIRESLLYRPPTAELRENQKDEDTLPPYPVLDPILKGIIEEDVDTEEVIAKSEKPQGFIRDVLLQFDRSEYKRRQAPLILKVSFKDLQTGRIFPIVQNRTSSLFPGPGEDLEETSDI